MFYEFIALPKHIKNGEFNVGKSGDEVGVVRFKIIDSHNIFRTCNKRNTVIKIGIVDEIQIAIVDDVVPSFGVHIDIALYVSFVGIAAR